MNLPKFDRRFLAQIIIALIFVTPFVFSNLFNSPLFYPRKSFVELILVIVAIAFALETHLRLPVKKILLTSGLLFAIKTLGIILHFNWVTGFNYLECLGFGITASYFMTVWEKYQFRIQNFYWVISLSCLGIVGLTISQFIRNRIISGETNPFFYSALFGNINMLSEYVILLLPILFYLLKDTELWKKYLVQGILGAWVFIILVGQSRAAWVGLGLILTLALVNKFLSKKEWVVIAISFLIALSTWFLPSNGPSQLEAKSKSLAGRLEIYRGALNMLVDNPLGVGAGQFEFNYLPYQMGTTQTPQELVRFESPHNEFIKWGIENGWAFLIAVILWWVLLFKVTWTPKDGLKKNNPENESVISQMILLAILPQLFFQFPFDNPASFLVMALLLGFVGKRFSERELVLSPIFKFSLVGFAVVFGAKTINQTYSRWIESRHPNDRDLVRLGCNLDPTNWRICFYDEMLTIQSSYPSDAVSIAKSQLRMRPFEFRALRVLGIYNFMDGKIKDACEIAHVYDLIFKNQSYFTPVIAENCQNIPSPLTFKTSAQFNTDYRLWIFPYVKN